jgi:phosphoglycolate phosphatase-like HAD superfamily hydrolase
MAVRAFIFDLDGTLWDSFPWYASIISGTGRIEYDEALRDLSRGIPVARLLHSSGISSTNLRAVCASIAPQSHLYPGVKDTLNAFKTEKIPLEIVTTLPGWMASPILDGLRISEYITEVIDYGKTARHKPHPDPLLAVLTQLDLSPSTDIWYVGDTEGDCIAAKAAGLSFACALYGYGNKFNGADVYLTKFSEIRDL